MNARITLSCLLLLSMSSLHCAPRSTTIHSPARDFVEQDIENQEECTDEKPCPPHITQVPHQEQAAHAVLPTCLNMLENIAEIVLDPSNPAVVGPSVVHILQDIVSIAHELIKDDKSTDKQEAKQIKEQCLRLKQKLEQYLKEALVVRQAHKTIRKRAHPAYQKRAHSHHECPECAKEEEKKMREQERKEDAAIIIGNVANLIGSFTNIVQDPDNPEVVSNSVANMLGSILHIGVQLMKKMPDNLDIIAQKVAHQLHG